MARGFGQPGADDQFSSAIDSMATAALSAISHAPKVGVLWTSFGPYHMARLRALASTMNVVAIEFASEERQYRWVVEAGDRPFQQITLSQGAWEDQHGWLVAARLWRKLNEVRPDVLLIPGYYTVPGLTAAVWGNSHGKRTILMSETNYEDKPRSIANNFGKKLLIRALFDGAVVGGKRAALYLRSLGLRDCEIAYKYDVVDNDFYTQGTHRIRTSQVPSAYGLPVRYFLYVGRLVAAKHIGFLLEAFHLYCEQGGSWSLVLAGDGPLKAALRKQAAGLLLSEKIHFAGHLSASQLLPYYAFASCFVLPSIREAWGLVVNEAMASSLPLIVSRQCGCCEDLVVDGQNGIIVDPTNVNSLVEAMRRVSDLSDAQRAAMGHKSSQIVSNYSLGKWASEVAQIIQTTSVSR